MPDALVRGEKACPICGRPALADYRPFCSKRCADVDLARWLGGRYAIPVAASDDGEEDAHPRQADNGTERS